MGYLRLHVGKLFGRCRKKISYVYKKSCSETKKKIRFLLNKVLRVVKTHASTFFLFFLYYYSYYFAHMSAQNARE